MGVALEKLRDRVERQGIELPGMYGAFDFNAIPERLALRPEDETELDTVPRVNRADFLADQGLMDLMAAATMLGDAVCDAYVALIPTHGMHGLITMLRTACQGSIDDVEDPPDELRRFITELETVPAWIDLELVAEGARLERISAALLAPFGVRGAFLATFLNSYAALPMAVTGSLSDKRSAKRVNETAAFFASTVLPGGMDRNGPGFEAAAMVRLMHSMVRYNALRPERNWDQSVYGVPIPQVDQMPAGLITSFLMAVEAVHAKRGYTDDERAMVEMARYRCYLLGLPEVLLPDDPEGLMRVFLARAATLRRGYDDSTCGELVRGTLAAYLRPDTTLKSRVAESFERSFSTAFFIRAFLGNDANRAAEMGVSLTGADKVRVALGAPFIFGRHRIVSRLNGVARLQPAIDRYIVRRLNRRLRDYGHAEYRSDAASYTDRRALVGR